MSPSTSPFLKGKLIFLFFDTAAANLYIPTAVCGDGTLFCVRHVGCLWTAEVGMFLKEKQKIMFLFFVSVGVCALNIVVILKW